MKSAKTPEELQRIAKIIEAEQQRKSDRYERHKAAVRKRQAKQSAAAREIADTCPPCKCLETRKRFDTDLKFALETLFPLRFNLAWGPDHLELIADIEGALNTGEQAVRALPRGTGKTSLLICSFLVGILTGKHPFAVLIGATGDAAKELLEQITTELESNDELYSYFPELIHPIRCLEGIHQRKLLWNGQPIQTSFKKDRIVLPSVPDTPGASAIIKTAGLLGRIRGMNFQRPDGTNVRPTLVLIDDPQTDASAVSARENDKRESVVCSTIPGLAGPAQRTAVIIAVTVKARDDLADRLLDRQKHPEWHGKRTQLIRFSKIADPEIEKQNADLWNQYAEILRNCQRRDEPITAATEFYLANQPTMDVGMVASWPARHNKDEASAIQYGMNLKIANPSAFASEYQNEPLALEEMGQQVEADDVVKRLSGFKRSELPDDCETITAGVDVQKNYLVYTLTAWNTAGTPSVIDYGTWPDQKTDYFNRRSSTRTIARAFPEGDADSQLWSALTALESLLLGKKLARADGDRMAIAKIAIDVRYKGAIIKRWIKASTNKAVFLAAQGVAIQPGRPGINDAAAKIGEISKHEFRLPPLGAGQIVRTATFDSDEYISMVHDALMTPIGSAGALTLFTSESHRHRCFADQVCAEYSVTMEVKGRKKRVWNPKPNAGDNDFLDSTKLSFLAAYASGVEPAYVTDRPAKKKTDKTKKAPRYAVI